MEKLFKAGKRWMGVSEDGSPNRAMKGLEVAFVLGALRTISTR
jgi:hypothetical protein